MDINSTQTPAMPREINVVKAVVYDVQQIIEDITAMDEDLVVTLDMIRDYLQDWVDDDFGGCTCSGHLTWTDENGEEL